VSLSLSNKTAAAGQANAVVGTLSTSGTTGTAITYSLVPGAGDSDNASFQIVNGQLETVGALAAGTYQVRVRSSSNYLISDVVDLGGVSGPLAYEVSYDPTQVPSSSYLSAASAAGLVSLVSDSTGSWTPAVNSNLEVPGAQAQVNYPGPYSSYTAANPSATLAQQLGSSGLDTTAKTAWAVIDHGGEYAAGIQVFTEETFTITVS
jgi:hypothetical protein